MRSFGKVLVVFLILLPLACLPEGISEEGDDSGGNGGPSDVDATTCDDWKMAYCNHADECSFDDFNSCFSVVDSVRCKGSAPLSRCVRALNSGCDEVPDECEVVGIADTSRAEADCRALRDGYCRSLSICDPATANSFCASDIDLQLPCERAFAVTKNYDVCMKLLNDDNCEFVLPDACIGVISLR